MEQNVVLLKRGVCTSIVFIVLLFSAPVQANFQAYLPFAGDTILGLEYGYGVGRFTPSLRLGYDFNSKVTCAGLELSYEMAPYTWYLSVERWPANSIPGSGYQDGVAAVVHYEIEPNHSIRGGVFLGKLYSNGVGIGTSYFCCNYQSQLFFDWDREIYFELKALVGQEREGGAIYSVSTWQLPMTFNNLKVRPWLAFSTGGEEIEPRFDLASLVRGYSYDEVVGTRGFGMTLEKNWALFPYSSIPFLGLLNVVTFVDLGGILEKEELVEEFKSHKSLGVGLGLNLGGVNLNLVRVINERKEGRFLFYGSLL